MAQLNFMHFLVAKKVAGKVPGSNRAAIISAMSSDPITAVFAGRSAKLQHQLTRDPATVSLSTPAAGGGTTPPSNGAMRIIEEEQMRQLGTAYRKYQVAPENERAAAVPELVAAVEKILSLA